MDFRIESDSIGEKKVPKSAYYGINTLRAADNFKITGLKIHEEFIKSIVEIKKAAAITNEGIGLLGEHIKETIVKACDEIIEGKFKDQFITDPIQGGAGTSINMNVNEVVSNRSIELLGGEKGNYNIVNPNDHVNMGQSTNDVIPTAGKITTIKLILRCIKQLKILKKVFKEKAEEFNDIIKMGRTQLQDAVPIRLGQEFNAYSSVIKRDILRLNQVIESLKEVNIGGTAIGTGINTDMRYQIKIIPNLSKITQIQLNQAEDLIDSTQNLDSLVITSSVIRTCAVNLSKIANDLRLMSSGPRTGFGEINLPAKQNGSSIMPGKVNPVIPEVINQIAFNIIGNDVTINMAAEAGQLELNAFEPIMFFNLFQSIETLTNGINTFVENCVQGITANRKRCKGLLENSIGILTALCPYVGYKEAAEIAKRAMNTGESVRKIILREKILDEREVNSILNTVDMTKPRISRKYAVYK